MIQLRYPQIRHFAPSASFQAVPVIGGEKLYGPDFRTQAEAAYAVLLFHEILTGRKPDFEVAYMGPANDRNPRTRAEADAKAREAVEKRVRAFVAERKLTPLSAQQPAEEKKAKASAR